MHVSNFINFSRSYTPNPSKRDRGREREGRRKGQNEGREEKGRKRGRERKERWKGKRRLCSPRF